MLKLSVKKNNRRRNKNICKNCYGKNWLVECKCGKCNELIPVINKWGAFRRYKRGHNDNGVNYWIGKKGSKHPAFKCRVVINGSGYCIITIPDHPKARKSGHILLHRVIYEYFHKCCLLSWVDIHHINGKTTDNHKQNLEPIIRSKHTKRHKIKDMSDRICLICDSNKTYVDGKYEHWYKYNDGFICKKCYIKLRCKKIIS